PLKINQKITKDINGYNLGIMIERIENENKIIFPKMSGLYDNFNPNTYYNIGFDIDGNVEQTKKTDYKVYNLGSFIRKNNRYQEIGNDICSVKDIAKNIINITDIGVYKEILYPEENKNIEPGHIYLDATKIYKDIGWYPKTNLEEGLKRTIYFYKQNIHYLDNSLKEDNFTDNIVFLDLNEHHELMYSE
ncbi:MAG: hypothetical protein AABY22_27920, partial [Nanoarchaeota archaeon]